MQGCFRPPYLPKYASGRHREAPPQEASDGPGRLAGPARAGWLRGKGREGKGREGRGRDGKEKEKKGKKGKGREGKGREGKGLLDPPLGFHWSVGLVR